MNRFFSTLDLREIRIDARAARFGPDDVGSSDSGLDAAGDEGLTRHPPGGGPYDRTTDVRTPGADATGRPDQSHDGAPVARSVAAPAPAPIDGDDVLKVSARSRPSAVAGAIAGVVRDAGRAEIQAIGAGATNQAVKAVAIARDYLRETGIEAICLPAFIDVTVGDEDRTAIRLVVEPR